MSQITVLFSTAESVHAYFLNKCIYIINITSKSPKTLYNSLCQRFVYHCIMPLCCLLALVANTTATTKFTYHLPQSKIYIYITSIGLYTLMPVSLVRCLLWGHTHMRIKTAYFEVTPTWELKQKTIFLLWLAWMFALYMFESFMRLDFGIEVFQLNCGTG